MSDSDKLVNMSTTLNSTLKFQNQDIPIDFKACRKNNIRFKARFLQGLEIQYPKGVRKGKLIKIIRPLEQKLEQICASKVYQQELFQENSSTKTLSHVYTVCKAKKYELIEQDKRSVLLGFPEYLNPDDIVVKHELYSLFLKHLRKTAKKYIREIVSQVANQNDLFYNNLTIKNISSRWGSCSSQANLNFNIFLLLLKHEELLYVIHHELAHLKHLDHSKNFWDYLESIYPGAKERDRHMRKTELNTLNLIQANQYF